MTRFTFKNDVTWGRNSSSPRTFEVMAQNQAGYEAYAAKAGYAVKAAVLMLENTLAALKRPQLSRELQRYAHRYFLTGETLKKADADTITVILNQTLLGMTGGKMSLKIAATQEHDSPGKAGYVVANNRIKSPDDRKSYHNLIAELSDGKERLQGAIHITGERLDLGRLGVKSLIHEATHKYAGTDDYVYFENDGKEPKLNFHKKERALQNADSYAWFTVKVGRDGGEFKNKMYS